MCSLDLLSFFNCSDCTLLNSYPTDYQSAPFYFVFVLYMFSINLSDDDNYRHLFKAVTEVGKRAPAKVVPGVFTKKLVLQLELLRVETYSTWDTLRYFSPV